MHSKGSPQKTWHVSDREFVLGEERLHEWQPALTSISSCSPTVSGPWYYPFLGVFSFISMQEVYNAKTIFIFWSGGGKIFQLTYTIILETAYPHF